MEKRITELEIKVAYQEDTIEQLNEALSTQQLQLQHLEKKIGLLSELVNKVNDELPSTESEINSIEYEVPPHF